MRDAEFGVLWHPPPPSRRSPPFRAFFLSQPERGLPDTGSLGGGLVLGGGAGGGVRNK